MSDRQDLTVLRWHWDAFYAISLSNRLWLARRRDDGRTLAAASATELQTLIRDDYASSPFERSQDSG